MNHEAIVEALKKAREAARMNTRASEMLDDIERHAGELLEDLGKHAGELLGDAEKQAARESVRAASAQPAGSAAGEQAVGEDAGERVAVQTAGVSASERAAERETSGQPSAEPTGGQGVEQAAPGQPAGEPGGEQTPTPVASEPAMPVVVTDAPAAGSAPLSRFPDPAPIEGRLSSGAVRVPPEIERCSGIVVHGQRIRSFAYSTDVAVIRNTNADAILAVYPFTGHPIITQAILSVAKAPVFTGVGGGTTTGQRVLELAMFAEMQGVQGVVLNAPAPVETVRQLAGVVDIPVVATILAWDDVARAKVDAGARIINVAAGRATADVVRALREEMPELPVIATGGRKPESILATIEAGANAVSWTPPDAQELQGSMMDAYRAGEKGHAGEAAATERPRLSAWLAEKGL